MAPTLQPSLYEPAQAPHDGGAMALTLSAEVSRKLHEATAVWNRRTEGGDTAEQFLSLVLDAKLRLWEQIP